MSLDKKSGSTWHLAIRSPRLADNLEERVMNIQHLALASWIAKEHPGSEGKIFHSPPVEGTSLSVGDISKSSSRTQINLAADLVRNNRFDVILETASPALAVACLRYNAWKECSEYINGSLMSGLFNATLSFFFQETQREIDELLRFLDVPSLSELDLKDHVRYPITPGA